LFAGINVKQPTILIADPDPSLQNILRKPLEAQGFNVLAAADSREARDHLTQAEVDLALIDFGLPDEGGLELLRYERQRGYDRPLLMLAFAKDQDIILRCFENLADDFIIKPINPILIVPLVRAHLRRSNPNLLRTVDKPANTCAGTTRKPRPQGRMKLLSFLRRDKC